MRAKVESPEMLICSSGSICTATVRLMRAAYSMASGLSPVPDVRKMTRQATRHDEHGIDAHRVSVAGIARREALGGHRDTAQAIFVERPVGRLARVALF